MFYFLSKYEQYSKNYLILVFKSVKIEIDAKNGKE